MNEHEQAAQDLANVIAAQTARANGRMGQYALYKQAMGGQDERRNGPF